MKHDLCTPYELGDRNHTTTLEECIAFYQMLAQRFPRLLRFWQIGESDAGLPMYAGLVSADGVFDAATLQAAGRTIFFNNNGIHPGEPEGIDVCMALVRDFCTRPDLLALLGRTAFLFIPVYNVDGCANRNNSSRVNQDGPHSFGFRGNSLHLDLNRDFLKCDSLAAAHFNRFFAQWQPDLMVDTHTSNGADYPYVMTLIPSQPDKLGGALGAFLRERMLPRIYRQMRARGWPSCPYVNPVADSPDQGIADFLETPRYSTGYAALHHCIGFMPETHMLKSFAQRYDATRILLEEVLHIALEHGEEIRAMRAQARAALPDPCPVFWQIDMEHPARLPFEGYAACRKPSALGDYQRLYYDRTQAWSAEIDHFDRARIVHSVRLPRAYLIPQQWRAVIERLEWNGLHMQCLPQAQTVQAEVLRIVRTSSRSGPYEGQMFHDEVELTVETRSMQARAGDYWLALDQPGARYALESLEPLAHDSFFRWGFFNSILEKKEHYSDYVFEDLAQELLQQDANLAARFQAWRAQHPGASQEQTLDFIYHHCQPYAEDEWRRYPVLRVMA
ncbi:M14 family zinc carboxypeptidase [Massilia sp. W12]|uniref:M14 family zinc carboxypeptidase n=1 Tax=Massilia sp. W12 TaxID=3126507 RepID=UPI0030CB587D